MLNSKIEYTLSIVDNISAKILEPDLKQLLIIFFDNSIKYNNKDTIKIHVDFFKNYNGEIYISSSLG